MENWTKFFNQLLKLEEPEIATAEKEYLYYYLGILQEAWSVKKPFFKFYPGVRSAAATIRRMLQKTGFQLEMSAGTRLLLRAPLLWKLYVIAPDPLHNCLRTIKRLIKKQ